MFVDWARLIELRLAESWILQYFTKSAASVSAGLGELTTVQGFIAIKGIHPWVDVKSSVVVVKKFFIRGVVDLVGGWDFDGGEGTRPYTQRDME